MLLIANARMGKNVESEKDSEIIDQSFASSKLPDTYAGAGTPFISTFSCLIQYAGKPAQAVGNAPSNRIDNLNLSQLSGHQALMNVNLSTNRISEFSFTHLEDLSNRTGPTIRF